MKTYLFLLVALTACSGNIEELPSDVTTPEFTDAFIKQHDSWCKSHFCFFEATTYTPAGEGMYDIVSQGLARFAKATGRTDLTTDVQSGIPVLWKENIRVFDPALGEDAEVCANTVQEGLAGIRGVSATKFYTQAIYLDPTPPEHCPAPKVSLLHELIHGMAPSARHVLDAASLFYEASGGNSSIDYAALAELCSHFNCVAFNPEL